MQFPPLFHSTKQTDIAICLPQYLLAHCRQKYDYRKISEKKICTNRSTRNWFMNTNTFFACVSEMVLFIHIFTFLFYQYRSKQYCADKTTTTTVTEKHPKNFMTDITKWYFNYLILYNKCVCLTYRLQLILISVHGIIFGFFANDYDCKIFINQAFVYWEYIALNWGIINWGEDNQKLKTVFGDVKYIKGIVIADTKLWL